MTNTQKLLIGGVVVAVAVVAVVKMSGNDPPAKADAGPTTTAVDTTPPPIMSAPRPGDSKPTAEPAPAGTSIDIANAAFEAKMVTRAQSKLDKGDYKGALQEIEDYEKIPNRELLTEKATVIKIAALSHVGRRTDALALAMETRDDPKFKDYHEQIEDILVDAGVHQ
jgi:hypothetical protein